MSTRVLFRPEADLDVGEAYGWYSERGLRLGGQFVDAVDECTRRIAERPEAFPKVHGEIRRALLRRFPCGIFYIRADSEVVILVCFHAGRHPSGWQSRASS